MYMCPSRIKLLLQLLEELLLLLLRHIADVDLGALARGLALALACGLGLALALGRGMQKDLGALRGPGGRRVALQVEQVVDGLAVGVQHLPS